MSVLPRSQQDLIQFCELHASAWAAAPATAIGLTAAQVTSLANAAGSARGTLDKALAARDNAKAQTITLREDVSDLRTLAASLVAQIKAFADLQANPAAVYTAAQIPEPQPPSPVPAPGQASNVVVTLESSGAVTLSWDAANAAASGGAFFNVSRRLPGQSTFVNIGGAPGSTTESRRMSYTDATVPTSAAASGVQYIITGQRGSTLGAASSVISVIFGVGGAGATVTGATLQMAA